MTTDPEIFPTVARPRLILSGEAGSLHPDASASIRAPGPEVGGPRPGGPGSAHPGDVPDVIWHLAPGMPVPAGAKVCVVDGLAAAAELAVGPEQAAIVPRAEVRKAAQRFGFTPGDAVSGFSTYRLDPVSASAYEVVEEGRTVPLGDWLARAAALGFAEVWLHSPAAEAAHQGFPCAMLAKANRLAPEMRFWISGGGWQRAHFETAASGAGLSALVVPADVAAEFAPGELTTAISAPANAEGRGAA